MSDIVLEGGIGNYKYIWHSNDCACAKCQALDGTEYDNEKDIPDKPHPNCKCYVEVVDENGCNCLLDLIIALSEITQEAINLKNEIIASKNAFGELLLTKKRDSGNVIIIENIRDALDQLFGTVDDFIRNYNDMKEANVIGADKYFHSKANCEGTQRGEFGELVAKAIGDLRELTDLYRNIIEKGYSLKLTLDDKDADLEANKYGREQGKAHPEEDSSVLVDIYRPNGLPNKY